MARVLLADDHAIVLDGLEALLSSDEHIEIVGTCVNGLEVIEAVCADLPDLVIMDVQMPRLNGLEVLRALDEAGTLPPTILIAASLRPEEEREARALGAWGVVLKDQASSVILECVHSALDGEESGPVQPATVTRRALGSEALTARENEIANRVSRGISNKRIAGELGIAEGTVKAHLSHIYQKMNVGNRVRLALFYRRHRRA